VQEPRTRIVGLEANADIVTVTTNIHDIAKDWLRRLNCTACALHDPEVVLFADVICMRKCDGESRFVQTYSMQMEGMLRIIVSVPDFPGRSTFKFKTDTHISATTELKLNSPVLG
jgi:hypothetical protein